MSKTNEMPQEKFKTMIGGQALIEGIMMRGPDKQAVVVRKKDGSMSTKVEPIKPPKGAARLPLIRGIVGFFSTLVMGMKSLMYSAEESGIGEEEEEEEPQSKFDQWLEKKIGSEKFMQVAIYIAVLIGLGFSIGMFFVLPILLGDLVQRLTDCSPVVQHLIEGLFRIGIFLTYLIVVSRMKDMRRVFCYHGAEHKSIRCYEAKLPLTVDNVRPMTRMHPRCGTSFLFVVMFLSILIFTVASYVLNAVFPGLAALQESSRILYNLAMMGIKLVILLPLVVSVGYELNRIVGRHDNWLTRILTKPGMWLQNFTTNEPDDSMMEVAIKALELVIPEQEGADRW